MDTPKIIVLPGRIDESMLLKGLLARWLRAIERQGEPPLPVDLLEATRKALGSYLPARIVVQLSTAGVHAVYSNVPGALIEICESDDGFEPLALMEGLISLPLPGQTT